MLFSRVVVIGVGLIGGSIGLAVKQRKLAGSVVGLARTDELLQVPLRVGAIDWGTTDFNEAINAADSPIAETKSPDSFIDTPLPELMVVATPVSQIPELVLKAAAAVRVGINYRNVMITDVGSTKESICSQLNVPLPNGCRFIGSHPVAGKEKSGAENADANLFENRLAIVTPTASVRDRDVGLLVRFWRELGSLVANMSPEEHDRTLARTSHLPHLLSALLADRLQLQDAKYTGPGYHSTTRLASGLPEMWRDIISNNTEAILEAIRDYENALKNLRERIEQQDWNAVAQFLEHAKQNRDYLVKE
jgi:prephenate dehydrogenase